MLVVDGPAGDIQKMARPPALPILHEKLADGAVVFLDDGKREDERRIVEAWQKMFDDFEAEFYSTNKGTWVLRRTKK